MAITKKRPLHTTYANFVLLEISILNKGTAFTARERQEFELDGFLPAVIETIDEQERRVYYQISQLHNDLNKHIFLRNIQDTNEAS